MTLSADGFVAGMSEPTALTVFVCVGPVCGQAGIDLAREARGLQKDPEFEGRLTVLREVCLGYCHQGPNVMLCANADAWGHAPLAGSPGMLNLHGMTLPSLRAHIAEGLAKS